MGRKRKLTKDEVQQLLERFNLYRANHPKRLLADFGISSTTLYNYLNIAYGRHTVHSTRNRYVNHGHAT